MNISWKFVAVTIVAAAVGFVLEAPGPVGSMIWPMPTGMAEPEGANLALLMLMGVFEALAFGLGVAFLVFGYPWVSRVAGTSRTYAILVYLSVAWLLVNWVPHTALHMSHGNINTAADYGGLVGIEYGFHLTLMVGGVILARFTWRALRPASAATTPTATAAPSSTTRGPA